MRLPAAVLTLPLALVVGCGSAGSTASRSRPREGVEEARVRALAESYDSAIVRQDWTTVCREMSRQDQSELLRAVNQAGTPASSCVAALAGVVKASGAGPSLAPVGASVVLGKITIHGDRADIEVTAKGISGSGLSHAVREGGQWKIARNS